VTDTILVSCAGFVVALLAGITPADAELALLRHPRWARRDADGGLAVRDPAFIAALGDLGLRCSVVGWRIGTVANWAERSLRPLLLTTRGHVLLAHRGIVYDNACPDGAPVGAHDDRAAKVQLALRVLSEPRRANR
jgi:hypothetical protein